MVREVVHIFETLFSYVGQAFRGFDGVEWEGITSFLSSWIERPFTEEEVKEAVFECDGNKAPGLDGSLLVSMGNCEERHYEGVCGIL